MSVTRRNEFDGKHVVNDLKSHPDKWIGCIWGMFCHFTMIPLRDIADGIYNADTLYLTTQKEHISFIQNFAKQWKADEVGYYCNGALDGVVDENLRGLDGGPGKNDTHYFSFSLGASPEKDVAYFRIWWD